jgi:exopolysaccharide biosynthesis polyprenyl glycosylphosphotransferase
MLVVAAGLGAGAGHDNPWSSGLTLAMLGVLAWAAMSRLLRQYDAANGRGVLGDLALTCVLQLAVVLPIWVAGGHGWLPGVRLAAVHAFILCFLSSILLTRLAIVAPKLWQSRSPPRVLIVGIGPLGRLTGNEILDHERHPEIVGYLRFDDEPPHERLHAPLLGQVSDLETTLRERVVDEVVVASTAPAHATSVQSAIDTCERFGVPFALPALGYRVARAKPASRRGLEDGYVHYLSVEPKPLQNAIKRATDIVVSATALVLLSPLLVAVAIAVKLTSPGPVLFRQERVGLHGRAFKMLKFRSMVADAERRKAELEAFNEQSGPVFKMHSDPRVTGVGRFIRKFSIDELPQIVNVLRGDMAIVGPRPPIPSEVARYEAWQRRRLSVRPGLTCVWQVSGRNRVSFQTWMLLDLRYIDHWNLLQDLSIVWRTVPVVLTGRGAS